MRTLTEPGHQFLMRRLSAHLYGVKIMKIRAIENLTLGHLEEIEILKRSEVN
jgi:hypothetical protein